MSVTFDIARTYIAPREVQARRMAEQREDRAIAVLMVACILIFVAQAPRLARQSYFDDTMSLNMLLASAAFGWVLIMPLVLYGIAALTRIVAKVLGGQGTWFRHRIALFWALLAAAPVWLLHGLTAGFVGPGLELQIVGIIALAAFVIFWGAGLVAAERRTVAT